MENIILIGMPGSGKSTVGVILAKTLGMDFIDTDLIIQIQQKLKLQSLVDRYGTDKFRDFEEKALLSVMNRSDTVIATGGSAVFCEKGMEYLKKNGICVYLDVPCDILEKRIKNIKTRGISAAKDMTIRDIFDERSPYYEKFADITVNCGGLDTEQVTAIIMKETGGSDG